MTQAEKDSYVPEGPDKRTQDEWDKMTLAELRAEWDRGPRFTEPPCPVDQNRFRRLTTVRAEITRRLHTKPPDGVTHGKGKKP